MATTSSLALTPRKTSRPVGQLPASAYNYVGPSPKDLQIATTRSDSLLSNEAGLSRRSFLAAVVTSASFLLAAPSTIRRHLSEEASDTRIEPATAVPQSTEMTTGGPVQTTNSKTFEETISGFIAGGALTATKTVVKYPLDTATVRLQMPDSKFSLRRLDQLMEGSFRGITTPLLWNVAGGAVFFAVKDATKQALMAIPTIADHLPHWAITFLAVAAAQCPYWLVRNPSEVVKTKQQAGVDGFSEELPMVEAFRVVRVESMKLNNGNPLPGFYTGYLANILYAYPADVIKFVLYDCLGAGLAQIVSPTEATLVAGAAATAISQLATNPLDVVRNRVMAGEESLGGAVNDDDSAARTNPDGYLGKLIRLGREEGLNGLFLGATPTVGKAILSGAIQFATYEQTKQHIALLLHR